MHYSSSHCTHLSENRIDVWIVSLIRHTFVLPYYCKIQGRPKKPAQITSSYTCVLCQCCIVCHWLTCRRSRWRCAWFSRGSHVIDSDDKNEALSLCSLWLIESICLRRLDNTHTLSAVSFSHNCTQTYTVTCALKKRMMHGSWRGWWL